MIRRVYKYPLRVDDVTTIEMPEGAIVLTVQGQYGRPQLWALIEPDRAATTRRFRVAGTGHDIEWQDGMTYRGTFQLLDGRLVMHLFEYADDGLVQADRDATEMLPELAANGNGGR